MTRAHSDALQSDDLRRLLIKTFRAVKKVPLLYVGQSFMENRYTIDIQIGQCAVLPLGGIWPIVMHFSGRN